MFMVLIIYLKTDSWSLTSDAIENLKLIYPTANVIMGGDFNMVYDEWLDRFPPKSQ